ncbi:MAG: undecaprenyl-diphosphate phosphatase [Candidatus Omnitrophica bacterium]|nr:undecaprenyl-diphosphate phosphatase [Candidatus Omnitrophota bacterium]MCF7894317.1 undecaprenyl-diphosphate phosphatase [Candidatus Omnitrophota bacterium]
MLTFIYFSLIQGLSEFLPISSSGHLFIFKNIFSFQEDLLSFFVFLHIATLAAVLVFFYKDIFAALKNKKIVAYLIVATAITALLGLIIDKTLSHYFSSNHFIFIFLFINGLILLTARNLKGNRELSELSIKDALFLGVLQGFSFFPGVSRSGITIIGLLARRFKPKTAFSLSFIMSVFPIAGTFLFKVSSLTTLKLSPLILIVSFLVTFVVGIFSLFLVKRALIMKKFIYFGYYCIILSVGGFLFIN